MKLNERSVARYATGLTPADHAGFLQQRGAAPAGPGGAANYYYRRRWFVLKGNLLFYFEERASREPLGLIVLEGCTVELCQASDFAFAVRFDRVPGARPYVLAADGPGALEAWLKALSRASFGYMRLLVRELERQLEEARARSPGRGAALRRSAARRAPAPGREDASAGRPEAGGMTGDPLPPPPPRRPPGSGPFPGLGDSPVSPETACFARLHDWFGQEMAQLRREWGRTQSRGHRGGPAGTPPPP
ncbi:sesquipedalian-2 [Tachyglossus aculeatus]|uniref:sesquipedalian-2 n=1 Tax=Tachyglossus aculeatus TaxID=9261 RepID=UPI0018F2F280|nr:sesquipedalian-2 [Tachyglossus aculeatus]